MKRLYLFLLIPAFGIGAAGCSDSKETMVFGGETTVEYTNPIVASSIAEPALGKGRNGVFYMFTGDKDSANLLVYSSSNLVSWTSVRSAFTTITLPSFLDDGKVTAPNFNFTDGHYVLYYTLANSSGSTRIGASVSLYAGGPYQDKGNVFAGTDIENADSASPFFVEADGAKYLFWSEADEIFAITLSADGLTAKEGAQKVKVASGGLTSPAVVRKGDYYYLFATRNTTTVVVGRSSSVSGPYVDANGAQMLSGAYEVVVDSGLYYSGVSNTAGIVTDDKGVDWMVYGGYDAFVGGEMKQLLDKLEWTDGWPMTSNRESSSSAVSGPAFFQLAFNYM